MTMRYVTQRTMPLYNASADLLEGNVAAGRGSRPYLVTDETTLTYDDVLEAANAFGAGLLELGLSAGDRLILATGDSVEFVVTFWGAMKGGVIPVPVAQGLAGSDFHFILKDSGAAAVVCDATSASAVLPAAQALGVRAIFAGDDALPDGSLRWSEVGIRGAQLEAAPTTADDIALWLYTSGTTGLPKAVMHRHSNLRAAASGVAKQVIGMGPDDVVLSLSKMFFAYGLGNSVYLPAAHGASVVIYAGPAVAGGVSDVVARFRPTLLFGVPAFFDGFARMGAGLPSSVRMVLSAGEALSAQLFDRFEGRFGLPLLDGLGATEALHHVTCNRPGDTIPGSAGRPLDGYDIQVRDRDDQPLPDGASGELWLRGPTTFAGYWRRPDLTARAYQGEWMRTGDVARIEDGRLFHEGRLDDLIKLGGIWVAPAEIEDVLRNHQDVLDAAVVATDDGRGVPSLKAFVTSPRGDNALRKELLQLCRSRLARFKIPVSYEVVDQLPRTPTGKLRRFVLRNQG